MKKTVTARQRLLASPNRKAPGCDSETLETETNPDFKGNSAKDGTMCIDIRGRSELGKKGPFRRPAVSSLF